MNKTNKVGFGFFKLGINNAQNYNESKRIILVNSLSFMYACISVPYFFAFFYLEFYVLSYLIIPLVISFLTPLYLNFKGYMNMAKVWMMVTGIIAVFLYSAACTSKSGIQYMYFPLLTTLSIIFSHQQLKIRLSLIFLIVTLFGLLEYSDYYFFEQFIMDPTSMKYFRFSVICNALISTVFLIHFQLKISNHAKITLNNLLNIYSLTERESEIVSYLCKGKSNKALSESLFIEEGTIKVHLNKIYRKFRVNSRTELMSLFIKH